LKQSDPVTGLEGGILVRAEQDRVVPKIFYTNSSYEYYGRAASLMHTTLDGSADAPLAANTRLYVMAGGNHGPGSVPPRSSSNTRYLNNANDYQWIMRGLLVAMQRWIAEDVAPPPSVYPRVDRKELATIDRVRFPKLPGVVPPTRVHDVYRLDFGPDFRSRGIVTIEPPKMGPAFTILLPQVDADGNDIGGLKTPQVAVPLAAHTGWTPRKPSIGSPEELFSMVGSYFPFSRQVVTQRYVDRTAYLGKIRAAASKLVEGRYLLERDLPSLEKISGKEWDFVMNQPVAAAR
jgi:hypothetical protein